MFSSIKGFLNRHKKKFIVTTVIVGGTAFAIGYARKRIREWEERETKRFLDITKKKLHFESTEKTCNQTILSLAPAVNEAVLKALDTNEILIQLRNSSENKMDLWQELKVKTLARAASQIYSYTILIVALRIQLNLVGGYLYKDSLEQDSIPIIDSDLKQQYLSICHYFISEGIEKLSKCIESKVRNVVEPIPLKQKFTLKDTEQLFWSIQAALCTDNSDPLKQMISYFINDSGNNTTPVFKTILNETVDLMESEEVISLCISSVSRGFSLLFDLIAEFMNFTPPTNGKASLGESSKSFKTIEKTPLNYVNINQIELPLIKLIPIINGLTSQCFDSDSPNNGLSQALINQLLASDKIKILGANVYEVFSS